MVGTHKTAPGVERADRGCVPREGGPHLPGLLPGEGLHQGLHAVVGQHAGVVDELLVAVPLPADEEVVGHQRVPVVELVELHGDAVLVLELHPEDELGVELQPQVVPAEVLDVVLNDDLDGLPWEERRLECSPARPGPAPPMAPAPPRPPAHR